LKGRGENVQTPDPLDKGGLRGVAFRCYKVLIAWGGFLVDIKDEKMY
jgi:hypothetical protein